MVHIGLKLETLESEEPGVLVGLESLVEKGLVERDPKGIRARLKVPIQHNFDCAGVDSLVTIDSKFGEFRNMILRLENTAEAMDHEGFMKPDMVEELDEIRTQTSLLALVARSQARQRSAKRSKRSSSANMALVGLRRECLRRRHKPVGSEPVEPTMGTSFFLRATCSRFRKFGVRPYPRTAMKGSQYWSVPRRASSGSIPTELFWVGRSFGQLPHT